jgi:hypothetical protein
VNIKINQPRLGHMNISTKMIADRHVFDRDLANRARCSRLGFLSREGWDVTIHLRKFAPNQPKDRNVQPP